MKILLISSLMKLSSLTGLGILVSATFIAFRISVKRPSNRWVFKIIKYQKRELNSFSFLAKIEHKLYSFVTEEESVLFVLKPNNSSTDTTKMKSKTVEILRLREVCR